MTTITTGWPDDIWTSTAGSKARDTVGLVTVFAVCRHCRHTGSTTRWIGKQCIIACRVNNCYCSLTTVASPPRFFAPRVKDVIHHFTRNVTRAAMFTGSLLKVQSQRISPSLSVVCFISTAQCSWHDDAFYRELLSLFNRRLQALCCRYRYT